MKKKYLLSLVILGLVSGSILAILKLGEYSMLSGHLNTEIYSGLIGAVFLGFGLYLGFKLMNRKESARKNSLPDPKADPMKAEALGISGRELEVMEQMSIGKTNQEIADSLFISLNTVKSHTKNLYGKLEVRNRTEAIAKARELGLLP